MGADTSCIVSQEPHNPDETPLLNSPLMDKYAANKLMSRFPDAPNVETIEDLFQHTKSIAPDADFYGKRDYSNGQWQNSFSFISREQFSNIRNSVGSYLCSLGLNNNEKIGIMSFSRIEWVVAQYACYGFGFIPVPIYDTFGWKSVNYIIKHAELHVSFVISTKVDALLQNLDEDSCLQHIIVIDAEDAPYNFMMVPKTNIKLHKYQDAECYPSLAQMKLPRPSTPAFIMYTSGTTGDPKGCVITHANFISTAASIYCYAYPFNRDDRMLSYLPLAHVYENVQHVVSVKVIGKVAFYSGSISRLVEEIKLFKPTIICGVSRVFERIHQGIIQKINEQNLFIRSLFYSAFYTKSFLLNTFRIRNVPLLDKVFDSVCEALGGNVKLFVSGGSALPQEIQSFLRIACRASFIQGYGLTESTSSCCVQRSSDILNSNCGALLPWCEAKFRSVDHYLAKDMTGELLIRGASIFSGYYKDEKATSDVFTEDGFFKTGDIFTLTKTGQLSMIGRCKDNIKLSQGEYISLQKLYDIYNKASGIKQIYIHAGMESRFLVAIVVPEFNGASDATILSNLDNIANQYNLLGYEKIKAVYVTNEEFTNENGMLTPSLKLSSYNIQKYYATEIRNLENSL